MRRQVRRDRHGRATVSGERGVHVCTRATVRRERMGRPDARHDPRVRRPVGTRSVEPFRKKRSTAMWRMIGFLTVVVTMTMTTSLGP